MEELPIIIVAGVSVRGTALARHRVVPLVLGVRQEGVGGGGG